MCNTDAKQSKQSNVQTFSNGTNGHEVHPKRWLAVVVKMNTERSVSQKLDKMGVENFVPIQKEVHQWSDRKKIVDRVVIPMILFVFVDVKMEKLLKTYSFIQKFITYPGETQSAEIPVTQIKDFRYMLNKSDSRVEISDSRLALGDRIQIISGPLKGLTGELCGLSSGKTMVAVRLDGFGYACTSISMNDIKSV